MPLDACNGRLRVGKPLSRGGIAAIVLIAVAAWGGATGLLSSGFACALLELYSMTRVRVCAVRVSRRRSVCAWAETVAGAEIGHGAQIRRRRRTERGEIGGVQVGSSNGRTNFA